MTQDTVVLFTSDQVNEFKRELEAAAGMPVDQLMDKMQKEHDEIAAGAEGEYELNAEQFGTIRKAYTENKEAIFRIADVIEKKLPALEATLAAGKAQMAAATKMLDQLEKNAVQDCIECGCCLYSCPANIPLLDVIRQSKAQVMGVIKARAAAKK